MSQPRHPNVLNLSEADPLTREKGTRFGFTCKILGHKTGAAGIGCSWYEVPPGRTAFPNHYHCSNEEALFLLEGHGTLRIGKDTLAVGAGDYITLPTGPEHAHQLTNTGSEPLRYLCLSTLHKGAEVVGYPDSKKVLAMGVPSTWKFPEPGWLRVMCHADSALDYYEGEDVG